MIKLSFIRNSLKQVAIMNKFQSFFEQGFFGVCTKLAERLGISTFSVRLFFIHASFLTFGSPIIVYLGMLWLSNLKKHLRRKNNPAVW
jgi:phage shock protein PspC (stress-responsive transcriptional regulator)